MNKSKHSITETLAKKKLVLNKRTIVKFSNNELRNIVGGLDDVTVPTVSNHGTNCTSVQRP